MLSQSDGLALCRYPDLPGDVQGLHDCCALRPAVKARKKASPKSQSTTAQDTVDALADEIASLDIHMPAPTVKTGDCLTPMVNWNSL